MSPTSKRPAERLRFRLWFCAAISAAISVDHPFDLCGRTRFSGMSHYLQWLSLRLGRKQVYTMIFLCPAVRIVIMMMRGGGEEMGMRITPVYGALATPIYVQTITYYSYLV